MEIRRVKTVFKQIHPRTGDKSDIGRKQELERKSDRAK